MDSNVLLGMIEVYGYMALFFCLWLGIVGMPIPDEVVVMVGGLTTSQGLLEFAPAFLLTYLGVISGLTLGYGIGRIIGATALERLARKKRTQKHLARAQQLIDRYGSRTLCISYFFPVVRHMVPYLLGIGRMPFARYALFSYSTGLVWTFLFFMLGRCFGMYISQIEQLLKSYGLGGIAVVLLLALGISLLRYYYNSTKKALT